MRAENPEANGRSRWRWRTVFGVLGLLFAIVLSFALRQVLFVWERESWPPPPDAITAAQAQEATEAFVAGDPTPHDVGLDYAWSTAATIEPWVEGVNFYPRIFADIERAENSVHILMFGWREGRVGMEMSELVTRKLAEGVEVRIIVDTYGSRAYAEAEEMFRELAAAGAQIVVNDVLPVDEDGLFPDRSFDPTQDEVGRADHRKLFVIDGAVAWTGGAGIEDHFREGGFHDVMVRVTGDVVLQAQSLFLASFRSHDAPVPEDLTAYFPEQPRAGTTPIALQQVVPGGFVSATQSAREMIDGATTRLDIMNPYLTDKDMIERIIGAAQRGVRVRVVVSERSNAGPVSAALKHRYRDLIDAGVEIWEYPDAVVHAKVIVADDEVQFGTLNMDAWALYRNFEIAMLARSPAAAERMEERLFEPDIARSTPGVPPSGFDDRFQSWLWDKLAYFL